MGLFSEDEVALTRSAPDAAGQAPPPEVPLESLPLAARMRPRSFDEFAGQSHLVGAGRPLRRAIEADRAPSCVFFGPAGTGKTTLARLCARLTQAHFEDFSAVTGGVADVRRIVAAARERRAIGAANTRRNGQAGNNGQAAHASNEAGAAGISHSSGVGHGRQTQGRTVLFVDEIHRFNRAQQDAFLPHVEDGTVTLIGATTENPLATVNTPLLSRCRLFRFEPLSEDDLLALLQRALCDERGLAALSLRVEPEALGHIARMALGDARTALNALEMAADLMGDNGLLPLSLAEEAVGRRALEYDKSGDSHYHIISAYIKSLRGGDPDAALVWMARMLDAGEDPMFIARRLVIQSAEDVGLADPHALPLAMAALQAVEKIGLPEAAIPLAQATVYLATAPKSNASYVALGRAREALANQPPPAVPMHLRAASLKGARERLGEGEGYIYPHDAPGHFAPQEYLPPGWKRENYYEPSEEGHEAEIARRLQHWWGERKDEG